ncbi:MAG: ACP S-malonyltransferase, partial [Bdellovibrionales bacterium]|nr:ACP S-malonyltransferase [Bdellovibrionales bacterium]
MIDLPVSAPFHCKLMQSAKDNLKRDLATLSIQDARFPVYANFSALPVSSPEVIRESLANQVCGKVRWVESMLNAIANLSPSIAMEFGTGSTLTGLLKRIDKTLPRKNVDSISSISN